MTDIIDNLEEYAQGKQIDFAEAMAKYDPVSAVHDPVHGSFIVMAERDPKLQYNLAVSEMGYTSLSPFTAWTRDERVGELRDRQGIRVYYDMKRSDGTVRGALRLVKTPILAGRWFVEPASDSALDKNIADFVEENLFEKLNVPWSRVVEDALSMCEYGYFPFEKVYEQSPDGKVRLSKIAPRHPLDIREWTYDINGGPNGVVMEGTEATGWESIEIPIEKMVVFVLEQEGGDMRGISILRSAYKHYYYKDTLYKIDAIQKERHGIGIPIIKLPMGFGDADKRAAEDLGRNLRTNERAHIVCPENWTIEFAKLQGQPVDCMVSIKHHDERIMGTILAPFYNDPTAKEDSMGMFFKATRYIAGTLTETVNHFVIPQLVDFNFARGGYPKLRVRRIGEIEDLRTLSFALRNFVGMGGIIPDDDLEDFLRRESDLPPVDKATSRATIPGTNPTPTYPNVEDPPGSGTASATPPAPGAPGQPGPPKVGLPRQSNSPPVGVGKSNTGRDTSGGKK